MEETTSASGCQAGLWHPGNALPGSHAGFVSPGDPARMRNWILSVLGEQLFLRDLSYG